MSMLPGAPNNIPIKVPSKDDLVKIATNALGSKFGNIGNLAGSSVSDIVSKLPITKDLFSSAQSAVTKTLGSLTSEVTNLQNTALSTVNNLATNLSGKVGDALQGVVTFTANASKDILSEVGLPNAATADISKLAKDGLSRLANFSGLSSITNNNQLTQALSNINSIFKDGQIKVSQFISDSSTDNLSFSDSLFKSDGVNHEFDYLSANSELADTLPSEYKIDKSENFKLNDLETQYKSMTGFLSNIPGADKMAMQVLGATTENYPTYTDKTGNPISNIFSNSSSSFNTTDSLYKNASLLCPGASKLNGVNNYKDNKNLFDMLLGLLSGNGLADLLKSMLNCGDSVYTDSRSKQILINQIDEASKRGDVSTLNVIADFVGSGGFANPESTIYKLAANYNTNSPTYFDDLKDLSSKLGVDYFSIPNSNSSSDVYSVQKIIGLGTNGTDAVSSFGIDEYTRNSAVACYESFSNDFA